MSLNQLLKSLRREFPKMRFYRNKFWKRDVIRSNYGDNKFLTVRILPNNQFRLDTVELMKLGIPCTVPSLDSLKYAIKGLVMNTNPELVGGNNEKYN